MKNTISVIVLGLCWVMLADGLATQYYVDGSDGDDDNDGQSWENALKTIGKGIEKASDNDTVTVADGTYSGAGNTNLSFAGEKITLQSQNGPTVCTIDCQTSARGFLFNDSGEDSDTVVQGFTIKNGSRYYGGAIYCEGSSPTIYNCTITDNAADAEAGWGGGIYCLDGGNPIISHCTITSNTAGDYGVASRARTANL